MLRLLSHRFGEVPAPMLARIRNADDAQIERWAEALLTATSLDQIFDDDSA